MKELEYTLEIKTESTTKPYRVWRTTEYDETKWNKILKLCEERKTSISDLIETVLDQLTPEQAEEILLSYDI